MSSVLINGFEHLTDSGEVRYLASLSEFDAREISVSGELPPGEYYVLIDNSQLGAASPSFSDDIVEYRAELVGYR
jgi:hypothetical protein